MTEVVNELLGIGVQAVVLAIGALLGWLLMRALKGQADAELKNRLMSSLGISVDKYAVAAKDLAKLVHREGGKINRGHLTAIAESIREDVMSMAKDQDVRKVVIAMTKDKLVSLVGGLLKRKGIIDVYDSSTDPQVVTQPVVNPVDTDAEGVAAPGGKDA